MLHILVAEVEAALTMELALSKNIGVQKLFIEKDDTIDKLNLCH